MGTCASVLIEHRPAETWWKRLFGRPATWQLVELSYRCLECSTRVHPCCYGHEQSKRMHIGCDVVGKHYALHRVLRGDPPQKDDPPVVAAGPRGVPIDADPRTLACAFEDCYDWPRDVYDGFEAKYGAGSLGHNISWVTLRELVVYDFRKHIPHSEEFQEFVDVLCARFPTAYDLDNTRIVFGFDQ